MMIPRVSPQSEKYLEANRRWAGPVAPDLSAMMHDTTHFNPENPDRNEKVKFERQAQSMLKKNNIARKVE